MAEATKKPPPKAVRKKRASTKGPASAGPAKSRKLVVVESPAKARTIGRYLGKDYIVKASMGHVRDLPRRQMGVDLEHGFKPTYEPLQGRKKVLTELKRDAKAASEVFLATDLDREGEAIAWHLAESFGIPAERIHRVIFNEITSRAIREAFAEPRDIDMHKVNAQQARRILDRIVGYQVSPLLWRKVAMGLSAGRVQSVAVRLIVEREREVRAFKPTEYWRIGAVFAPLNQTSDDLARLWTAFLAGTDGKAEPPSQQARQDFLAEHGAFRAELVRWNGERFKVGDAETALNVAKLLGVEIERIDNCENRRASGPAQEAVTVVGHVGEKSPAFTVQNLSQRDSRSKPYAPFTTATLQQAAATQLRFSTSRTMRIAQQLYEGVEIPSEGSVGLITYMRTDSRHLSAEAVAQVRSQIAEDFGSEYLPETPNVYASGARAQEAHEAVRPTDARRRPDSLQSALTAEQYKLYELIWRRFVACQMPPAVWKTTEADIVAKTPGGEAVFKAVGRKLLFDGFMRVAGRPKGGDQLLPHLETDDQVAPIDIRPTQHFTQPPPRYTEAALVKALEADGIGRPSTYANIIKTIQDREYVLQESRAFQPTELGEVVTDKLVRHFPDLFAVQFTARMEDQLDKVEEADRDWVRVLTEFYGPFKNNLDRAGDEMVHAKAETQPSDYKCPACEKPMVYRFSKHGRYLACTGYPDCKQTFPVDKDGAKLEPKAVDVACPKCGQTMILRRGRFGPFLSCSAYPDCDGVVNLDKKGCVKHPSSPPLQVDQQCPRCNSPLYLRRGKRGPWLSCSKYPKCRGRAAWKEIEDDRKKQLELELLNHEKVHPRPVIKKLDGSDIGPDHAPQLIEAPGQADSLQADKDLQQG